MLRLPASPDSNPRESGGDDESPPDPPEPHPPVPALPDVPKVLCELSPTLPVCEPAEVLEPPSAVGG